MKKTGMLKKTVMMALIACMVLAGSLAAQASEMSLYHESVGVVLPEDLAELETAGTLTAIPLGAIDEGHHVYGLFFDYVAMPEDEAEEILYNADRTEEDEAAYDAAECVISMVMATDVDFDSAVEAYVTRFEGNIPLDCENAEEVGEASDFTFYYIPMADVDDYLSTIDEEYAGEVVELTETLREAMWTASFSEPADEMKEMTGKQFVFTTTDLDGNTVTSEELFSENEITMINCWGVWCPNCTAEMEELSSIHESMQEKGCGIVGMEWEKTPDEDTYQEARDLMEESGTNYPNVLMPDEILQYVDAFPTSIFVDSEGTVIGIPIEGANVSGYERMLDTLLAGADTGEASGVPYYYSVRVADEDGPVSGVTVQFCDDTTCRVGETDEDGVATFEVPAVMTYEVHIMDVPEGYSEDDTVYYTTEGSGEVDILLTKADN